MDTVIAAPASCEVRAVIRFLHAEGQSAAALCPSALTLWQRVYFYKPIGGWFWNDPRS